MEQLKPAFKRGLGIWGWSNACDKPWACGIRNSKSIEEVQHWLQGKTVIVGANVSWRTSWCYWTTLLRPKIHKLLNDLERQVRWRSQRGWNKAQMKREGLYTNTYKLQKIKFRRARALDRGICLFFLILAIATVHSCSLHPTHLDHQALPTMSFLQV